MAWPFSKQKSEITRPDTSHISTTEDMTIPDKQEEPAEEKPQIPTSVFDTVVAKTTYALSDMFVIGHPYTITFSGNRIEYDSQLSKKMYSNTSVTGIGILYKISEDRGCGWFAVFVPHKNTVLTFNIKITADELNNNVNAVAEGREPTIMIERGFCEDHEFGVRGVGSDSFLHDYFRAIDKRWLTNEVAFINQRKDV